MTYRWDDSCVWFSHTEIGAPGPYLTVEGPRPRDSLRTWDATARIGTFYAHVAKRRSRESAKRWAEKMADLLLSVQR